MWEIGTCNSYTSSREVLNQDYLPTGAMAISMHDQKLLGLEDCELE